MRPNAPCPCHSGTRYKRCCGPWHRGAAPQTAEQLMRSRFAAYALGEVDYVLDTTHPAGSIWRPDRAAWAADIDGFCRSTTFAGLAVLDRGRHGDDDTVTFRAELVQHGRPASFVERSRFRRLDGRWMYVDAVDA